MIIGIDYQFKFWERVDKKGKDDCWLWIGQLNDQNYGLFMIDSKIYRATHISLILHGQPLAEGLCALHRCDNPPCVNPNHLFQGTRGDNIKDCHSKGRRPRIDVGYLNRGKLNGNALLTEEIVMDIKKRIFEGESNADLARIYKVDSSLISKIRNNHIWTHVKVPYQTS